MADDKAGQAISPRWVMIYMMVLILALVVWIILAAIHGGPPWGRHW